MGQHIRVLVSLLGFVWAAQALPKESQVAELAWIPRKPVLLMCFEKSPSADAELFRRFQDEFLFATGVRSRFQKLLSLTDLDPSLHIDRSIVAVLADRPEPEILVMARASRHQIARKALSANKDATRDPDRDLLRLQFTEEPSLAITFLDSSLVVFGESGLVEQSLDLHRASASDPGQEDPHPPRPISPSSDIDPGADFWAIASPEWLGFNFEEEILASASIRGRSLSQSLVDIETVTFSARVSSQVALEMEARAKDEEDAVILADALDQFLVSNLAGSRGFPELHKAVEAARTDRFREQVRFSMTLDHGALKELYHSETARNLITWRLGEETRERRQRISTILDALAIGDGSHVADVGAGAGFFTIRLARAVGGNGRVYGEDIDEAIVRALDQRARKASLANVEVVLGEKGDPKLPEGDLDAVLIVNAYHEMPAYPAMLSNIHRALKPGGRLVLIEPFDSGRRGDTRDAQTEKHVIDPDLVERELREAGFEIVERDDTFIPGEEAGRFDWLLVARRV